MTIDLGHYDWLSGHLSGQTCGVPGQLRGMRSSDPQVRAQAFDDFRREAHEEGAVDPCTAASLPVLFEMADDAAFPDRAKVFGLLLSIGQEALDMDPDGFHFTVEGVESTAHVEITATMPGHADVFLRHVADPDPLVRQAAIQGIGLFLGDGGRAVQALSHQLTVANEIVERLLVVRMMAELPARLPSVRPEVGAWLDALAEAAACPPPDAAVRLGALVSRALAAPDRVDRELVPSAVALLQDFPSTPPPAGVCADCYWCGLTSFVRGREQEAGRRSEHIGKGRFDPREPWRREHSPISPVLRALHTVLGTRAAERAVLLAAQLGSTDPVIRYDAIEMAQDFPGSLPRNVTRLLLGLLPDPYAAALVTSGFSRRPPGTFAIAPEDTTTVCDALAAYMAGQRSAYGTDVWASDDPLVRGAYQEAVMALTDHRDPRALPDLIFSLETRVEDWRALYGVGGYPHAALQLVPLLADGLRDINPDDPYAPIPAGLYLSCLAELKDPVAVPVLVDTLTWAVRHQCWSVAISALDSIKTFGAAAIPARALVESLAGAPDGSVRERARDVLEAIGAS